MRRARVRLTYQLLESMLHFPSGQIVGMRESNRAGELELLVESPDFGAVKTGDLLPERTIRYTREYTSDPDGKIIEAIWS